MAICIIYDTRRGSTAKIVEWIVEALRHSGCGAITSRVNQALPTDCDLVMIGAPIYYERPLGSVLRFLEL